MEEIKLSPIKRMALILLDKIKEQILTDCDDDEVAESLKKIHPDTSDYVRKDDYITADKAMKILGLGYNRSKFFSLTKKYNIINHTINNQHIGFLHSDIERLKNIIGK